MNNTFKTVALGLALALPAFAMAPASFAQAGTKMSPKMGGKMNGGPGGRMDGGRMGGRRGMGGGMMRRMEKDLALTPTQKTKLDAVMKSNRDKMRLIRESKASPDQKRTQMMAQRKASTARMNAILTPAQRSKVAAMQAEMKQRMQQGGPGGPGGKMGAPRGR